MFVIGAVFDFQGERRARRLRMPMLGVAFAVFAITQLVSGGFLLFDAYEALAMLAAMGMYLSLALKGRLEGSGLIAAGIVLNLLAAAIQAFGTMTWTIVVPFDHNGVFHLVQTAALAPLITGLSRGMAQSRPSSAVPRDFAWRRHGGIVVVPPHAFR